VYVVEEFDPDRLYMWDGDEWVDIGEGGGTGDFTQDGTGAITWSATERMKEQVYLLDFIPTAQHDAIRNDPNNTYDCSDALEAAMASLTVPHQSTPLTYEGGPEVIFPYGHCYFDRTIEMKKTMIFTGQGQGAPNAYSTRLVFKAGITGIVVNYLTTFEGGDVPGTKGANGSTIRNLHLSSKSLGVPFPADVTNGYDYGFSGYASDHWVGHGIWVRTQCKIQDCRIQNFPRNGLYIVASAGGIVAGKPWIYGNANLVYAAYLTLYTNGACGLYIDGPDTNACSFISMNCVSNRLSGIYDSALIFNTHVGHHADNNAVDGRCSYISGGLSRRYLTLDDTRAYGFAVAWANSTTYVAGQYAANGGNLYRQTVAVATSAASPATGPTGTGTNIVDNTCRWDYWAPVDTKIPPAGHAESEEVWNFIQNSPSGAGEDQDDTFPPWPYDDVAPSTTPKRYRRGHPYWSPQASNGSVFLGCYVEAQQPSSFTGGIVIGATPITTDSRATFMKSGGFIGDTFSIESRKDSDIPFVTHFNRTTDESVTWIADGDSTAGLAMVMDNTTDGCWGIQHARGLASVRFTTNLNTLTGNRSGALAGGQVLFPKGLWLGNAETTLRHVTANSIVPATGEWAAGDIVLNSAPLAGEPWAWRCIASGTPGTWQALRDIASQQTIATISAFTLTPGTSPYHTLYTGNMISSRPVDLSTTGATVGLSYKITRTATGAFDLAIGAPTTAWAATTAYTLGTRRNNDSFNTYVVVTAGTSGAAPGPTGTGAGIVDGTVTWDYVSSPLKLLATGQWIEVTFGTAYYVSAFGSL